MDTKVQIDAWVDAAPDSGADSGADLALDAAAEASIDGAPDAAAPSDATPDKALPDGPLGDLGAPSVWGYISRSASPLLDGKGNLYVGLYNPFFPIQVAGKVVYNADLSKAGTKIKYEIFNAPVGPHNLNAFLDDNKNVQALVPVADEVDLFSPTVKVTIAAGSSIQQDLVLSSKPGGDGGVPALIGLSGMVKASIAPAGDGKGILYLSLHTQLPPAGQVATTPLNTADLSSPFAAEQYFIGSVPAGQYYLTAFLDDNNTASFIFPAPDKGDMIMSQPAQVHVLAGVLNVQSITLDKIK